MKAIWGSSVAALLAAASSGAFAADLPVKAPPAPLPLPVYNWTGFYIGGNLGGASSSGTLTDNFTGASLTSGSHTGFIGGGQIGYNWQLSPQWVLGVEWMFDGIANNDSGTTVTILGDTFQGSAKTDWVTTFAARFGYAANNWLFYGKFGGGWVQNSVTVTDVDTGASVSASNTRSGWTAGAGIEYGWTHNWTVKAEWDIIELSNWHTDATILGGPFVGDQFSLRRDINMFTVGVNYKF
jgi:outer membrane immunogenic protein